MPNESEDPPEAYTGGDYRSDAEILRDQYPELKVLWDLVVECKNYKIALRDRTTWFMGPRINQLNTVEDKLDIRWERRLKNYYLLEKMLTE